MSEEEDQVRFVSPRPLLALSTRDSVLKLSAGARSERKASRLASDAMSKVKLVSSLARGEGATFQDSRSPNAQLQPVLAYMTM